MQSNNDSEHKLKLLNELRWRNRRRIAFAALAFYAAVIVFLLTREPDTIDSYIDVLKQLTYVIAAVIAGYFAPAAFDRQRELSDLFRKDEWHADGASDGDDR